MKVEFFFCLFYYEDICGDFMFKYIGYFGVGIVIGIFVVMFGFGGGFFDSFYF